MRKKAVQSQIFAARLTPTNSWRLTMTFHRFAGLACATALTAIMAVPADAQMSSRTNRDAPASSAMLSGNVAQVASAMADAGYPTERTATSDGTPKLDGKIDGWTYSVYFYGCNGDDCNAVQFAAGFDEDQPMKYDIINDWNTNNRFGRAYLDAEGDPWVEMDINMEGDGVSLTNFNESLAYWDTVLKAFTKHIGW